MLRLEPGCNGRAGRLANPCVALGLGCGGGETAEEWCGGRVECGDQAIDGHPGGGRSLLEPLGDGTQCCGDVIDIDPGRAHRAFEVSAASGCAGRRMLAAHREHRAQLGLGGRARGVVAVRVGQDLAPARRGDSHALDVRAIGRRVARQPIRRGAEEPGEQAEQIGGAARG